MKSLRKVKGPHCKNSLPPPLEIGRILAGHTVSHMN